MRTQHLGSLLVRLWGNGLPPGDNPMLTLAEDVVRLDDAAGHLEGYIVRGDRIALADVEILLRNSPGGAEHNRIAAQLLGLRARLDAPS
jgi:hypothetical protein